MKFRCKKIFCHKKFGSVSPGGRVGDTHPLEIVGLQLWLVVVSCLKKIFVPKQFGRVNPGDGLVTPPPHGNYW